MRKFNHDSDKVSVACGFDSNKDMYAYTISALSALTEEKGYTDLSTNEQIAIIALAAMLTRDTSLFLSTSYYTELIYNAPLKYSAIDIFINQIIVPRAELLIEEFTTMYNAE